MPTPLKRRLRLARRGAWYGIAVLLVLVALVVGVAGQLLPVAERNPERIAAWLSERAGRAVAFEQVQTEWTRRGPLLRLDGLRVGDGDDAVRVGEAEVLVSIYAGLLPGRSFTELRLRNLSLVLQRGASGAWSVQGLPGQAGGGDPLASLEGLGELQVIDAELAVLAPSLGWDLKVPEIDLRLQVDGDRVRAGALARARAGAAPVRVSLDFDRRSGDGRGFVQVDQAQLSQWTPILHFAGVRVVGGQGQARAWVDLRDRRIVSLTSQLDLRQVALRGAPLAPGERAPTLAFERFEGAGRWRVDERGWRLDVPSLRVGSARAPQRLGGMAIAGGAQWALAADTLHAGPVLQVVSLSDRLPEGARRWLYASRPTGALSQLSVGGDRSGLLHATGKVESLRLGAVAGAPGLSGLAGSFAGDGQGFRFEPNPEVAMQLDWAAAFGRSHAFKVRGSVGAWPEAEGWKLATSSLRIDGDEVRASLRGSAWFQGDGSRPRLELAAQVEDVPLVAAKQFTVRHRMPAAAVDWLDRALLAGQLEDGRFLLSGDLDDWPFAGNEGRLEASATVAGGRLKFHPRWPALEAAALEAQWLGNGLTITGTGTIAGVAVESLEARIDDFATADLTVSAKGGADAARLLSLVRQSPLNDAHAETLGNLDASGPAQATLELLQPLRAEGAARTRMSGTVELRDARISERRWNLDFDRMRGTAEYGSRGFRAESLAVRMQGRPGVLSLRAGDRVGQVSSAFEAELTASLTAAELLERAPTMAWLQPYVTGRSRWSVGVSVPKGSAGVPASRLQLRSDLVGTTLKLPAPLDKPASRALPTLVQTSLPLERGQVDVALGGLVALRARQTGGQTGIRVMLGGPVEQPAPASGLIVEGRGGALDAMGWIALSRSASRAGPAPGRGPRPPETPLAVRQIDVTSSRLLLLGAQFPDTRLRVVPSDGALSVSLDGPAVAGTLRVPEADGEVISGKFQRVHWRGSGSGTGTAAGQDSSADALDPAAVPPLALDIADLRFGEARLGSAVLRTRPVPAGLHVQQLALRSPGQTIDITGDWLGRGPASRTRTATVIKSENLGGLLDALGFKDHLRGGKGQVRFDAGWAGGPSAFAIGAIQGRLSIDARDGQLLELEPGAGRVLGLLSIAQLPRRVMLDFRDFFSKGFAFNRIDGNLSIASGVARSDDLTVEGPAAEIRIRGSTDLAAQRFDQTIEVLPRSGNLLTVVGAVAGGPLGAAVGAAANAVLRKPLGELGAKTYRVTGAWKDPDVELVREGSRAQVPARPAPDGPG